jgi:nuclear transport factor 2 (NTF2) superfamily protein
LQVRASLEPGQDIELAWTPSLWFKLLSGRPDATKWSIDVPSRPPLPPFTRETALEKVRLAEDTWNSRDPARVALAYTEDSRWRNRSEFFRGRAAIIEFLTRKWASELDYRLIKELWAFHENRISVRFQYECHNDSGHWFRAHGNEQWEFDGDGLMRRREASINDVAIAPEDRKFLWPAGPRPASHPGLTALGL